MSGELQLVDVTALASYLDKIRDLASINKMMGPTYLRDFIEGQDIAGALHAKAIQADLRAKAKLEQAEAIAYLDRASDYLKQRNIKDTSEARKMYISIDLDVIQALENKAKTEALVALLRNKLSIMRQAHDDLKKMLYDGNNGTQWEGM